MFGSTYNGQDFTSCKLDGRITTVLTIPLGVCSSLLWIWHLLPSLLTLFQIFPPQSRGSSSAKRRKTNAVSIFRGKCWHFHGVKNPRSGMVFSVGNVLVHQCSFLLWTSTPKQNHINIIQFQNFLLYLLIFTDWKMNIYSYIDGWTLYHFIDPNFKMIVLHDTNIITSVNKKIVHCLSTTWLRCMGTPPSN